MNLIRYYNADPVSQPAAAFAELTALLARDDAKWKELGDRGILLHRQRMQVEQELEGITRRSLAGRQWNPVRQQVEPISKEAAEAKQLRADMDAGTIAAQKIAARNGSEPLPLWNGLGLSYQERLSASKEAALAGIATAKPPVLTRVLTALYGSPESTD